MKEVPCACMCGEITQVPIGRYNQMTKLGKNNFYAKGHYKPRKAFGYSY